MCAHTIACGIAYARTCARGKNGIGKARLTNANVGQKNSPAFAGLSGMDDYSTISFALVGAPGLIAATFASLFPSALTPETKASIRALYSPKLALAF